VAYIVYKSNRVELNNSLSIGRSEDNEIVVNESTVSRNHALIKKIAHKYYLIDVGSSNGTYIDGKRIHNPTLLDNKSVVQCGNMQFIFYDNTIETDSEETQIALTSSFIVNSVVLVADIKGYTAFSEAIDIKVLSKIMSKWFKQVSFVIEESNGVIDSFIGDCVYARWDIDDNLESVARKVLLISKKINELTRDITKEHTNGQFPLNVGIGITYGELIIGNDVQNSGLGDTVNTAFRLEEKSKIFHVDIMITRELAEKLNIEREWITTQIKGKSKDIDLCAIRFDEVEKLH
jgi:adenylate cyclase